MNGPATVLVLALTVGAAPGCCDFGGTAKGSESAQVPLTCAQLGHALDDGMVDDGECVALCEANAPGDDVTAASCTVQEGDCADTGAGGDLAVIANCAWQAPGECY